MLFKKILVWTLSIYLMITLFISSQAQNYMWTIAGSQDTIETNGDVKSEEKNTSNSLNLECESAILIEQHSGQILYEHNIHEQLRPASVTKIMSILLIMEEIEQGRLSYEDKIACSETARAMGGSQIWLDTTETLTVNEMLKAICVVSANDCVVAMAAKTRSRSGMKIASLLPNFATTFAIST